MLSVTLVAVGVVKNEFTVKVMAASHIISSADGMAEKAIIIAVTKQSHACKLGHVCFI